MLVKMYNEKFMRAFVIILGANLFLILFYWNFKGYYWTDTVNYNILELQSLDRLINLTIDQEIYRVNNGSIIDHGDLNYTSLSETDRKLLSLERSLFDSDYAGPTSAPDKTQLFYVDLVSLVRRFRIGKTGFCGQHRALNTVIFVWSRVNGWAQRDAIRQTWANNTYSNESTVKVLFVIGVSNSETDMSRVAEEDRLYDDILQFDIIDSYHNCTLKSIGIDFSLYA